MNKQQVAPGARVALVGTGIMGTAMGMRLLDAGYELAVFNRTRAHAQALIDAGARWCDTPAAAVAGAACALTCVGGPADVEEVYLGRGGLLSAAQKGCVLVDLTTSSPESARELAAAAAELGLVAFDCPVTGGQAGAEAGTLSGFVGATREVAAPALPVLDVLCEHLFFFDTAGAGQVTKLCNQLSLAGCMLGMADALAFAREHGLDEDAVIAALATGMGSSRALTELGPKAAAGDFKPGFMAKDLRKDIALALLEANEQQLTLPGAQTAWTLYDTLCAIGGERLATQAITVLYQDEAEAVAAGLDWSRLDAEELLEREEAVAGYGHHGDACSCDDDDCGCGHDHVHESADACGCGHDHGEHHHHGHHRAH